MSSIYLGRNFKIARVYIYLIRAMVRGVTLPFCWAGESVLKHRTRLITLRLQNSLPIELALSSGDTAVQIGTPRPRTVSRFHKMVGPTGRVIVFEAEPDNITRLKVAFPADKFPNITIVAGAAWRVSGQGKLSISPYSGDHKINLNDILVDNDLREGNQQMETIDCTFFSIDDVMADLGLETLDYLSVTVNGAELEVLHGAEKTLRHSPNARIYAKGHAMQQDGTPLNRAIRIWLESLGFATIKTRGEPSSTIDNSWRWRAGDVYAWKPNYVVDKPASDQL
ncbi:MAG: FkbM family methyltransferase [Gammaproteobacteria bacterium]